MCRTCIHIGSVVMRVITQTKACQSPGRPSYLSLSHRLESDGLFAASIQICSSSRHIAWRSVRMMLKAISNTKRAPQIMPSSLANRPGPSQPARGA